MIFELSHPGAIVYVCGLSPFRSFFLGCISSDIVFSLRFVGNSFFMKKSVVFCVLGLQRS
uniref:Uncharacterized protein n=1 Tax=Helianthus annuus TaxID=4232 RepID=A0A251T9I8_HELAN